MRAVWYDQQGPAANVLQVGELPDPEPGPGEVRVRVSLSGVNPGDTKKRTGYFSSTMPFPARDPAQRRRRRHQRRRRGRRPGSDRAARLPGG